MTSPIWASDMLRTAGKLAGRGAGPGRPALCDLRRATSTAYYALFHQLIRHGALAAVPDADETDVANVVRWFTHTGVRKASGWVLLADRPGDPPRDARAAVELLRGGSVPQPGEVVLVADAFVRLQDARHDADYSNEYDPVRFTTLDHVATAEAAVRATWAMWRAGTSDRDAQVSLHGSYRRFLNLALLASGGPRAR